MLSAHEIDTSLHMNNGRYWTLMDLGRADLMIRSGLWRAVVKHRWLPVVSAANIRFRRELRLFRPFVLKTRIVAWADTWVVIEHQVASRGRKSREILNAVALVRVGLYDRRTRRFITVNERWPRSVPLRPHRSPRPRWRRSSRPRRR